MESQFEEKSDFWRTAGLLLIGLVIGYAIGRFELTSISFENEDKNAPKDTTQTAQETNVGDTKKQVVFSTDGDPLLGSEDAPVTIIDFSDYQCPFCKKFYSEIFPQLKADYIQTGKVAYVFRDFPLNIHPKAQYAHYAADCANEQNKYWEMHDMLFDKQDEWTESENLTETFTNYARELGLNTGTFEECVTSEKYRDEIEKDKNDGISYGIKGTPTFILNDKIIRGVSSYEQLKQLIEKEL